MATDIFLNFISSNGTTPAFKGESVVQGHEGEIRAQSLTWGYAIHNVSGTQGSGSGGGKVEFTELHFTKPLDSVSPAIYKSLAAGVTYPKVVITMRKNGVDFAVFTFGLSFFTFVDGRTDPDPMETIGLAYQAVVWQVKADPNKPLPSPAYGWNKAKNVPTTDPTAR